MANIGIGWVLLGIIFVVVLIAIIYLVVAHRPVTLPTNTPSPGGVPSVPPVAPATPIVNRLATLPAAMPAPTMIEEETMEIQPVRFVPEPRPAMRRVTIGELMRESVEGPSPFMAPLPMAPVVQPLRQLEPVVQPMTSVTPSMLPVSEPVVFPETDPGENVHDNEIGSLTDSRFTLGGDHPGINARDREVTFVNPFRHTIRLCNRGGFLRRLGRGAWQHVQRLKVGIMMVSYLPSGFFMYGDKTTKTVICQDGQNEYVLRISSP